MRISKEKKQEERISQLQGQVALCKTKIKSLENKLSTSERKRKSLMEENRKKNSVPQAYPFSQ
jgi:peptidoglycan hydrolase CwlO-like protein